MRIVNTEEETNYIHKDPCGKKNNLRQVHFFFLNFVAFFFVLPIGCSMAILAV